MKVIIGSALALLVLLPSLPAAAGTEEEIAHLLSYIEQSECLFVRNGKEYSSSEGLAHIERKYDHVRKRVGSAEDFIEYAASRSSMTGTGYLVRCGAEEVASAAWLKEELARFRETGGAASKSVSPDERSSP